MQNADLSSLGMNTKPKENDKFKSLLKGFEEGKREEKGSRWKRAGASIRRKKNVSVVGVKVSDVAAALVNKVPDTKPAASNGRVASPTAPPLAETIGKWRTQSLRRRRESDKILPDRAAGSNHKSGISTRIKQYSEKLDTEVKPEVKVVEPVAKSGFGERMGKVASLRSSFRKKWEPKSPKAAKPSDGAVLQRGDLGKISKRVTDILSAQKDETVSVKPKEIISKDNLKKPVSQPVKVPNVEQPVISPRQPEPLKLAKPAIEPAIEPPIEPPIEPAVEPAIEPAIGHAAEPAAEPATETTVQAAKEQPTVLLEPECVKETANIPANEPIKNDEPEKPDQEQPVKSDTEQIHTVAQSVSVVEKVEEVQEVRKRKPVKRVELIDINILLGLKPKEESKQENDMVEATARELKKAKDLKVTRVEEEKVKEEAERARDAEEAKNDAEEVEEKLKKARELEKAREEARELEKARHKAEKVKLNAEKDEADEAQKANKAREKAREEARKAEKVRELEKVREETRKAKEAEKAREEAENLKSNAEKAKEDAEKARQLKKERDLEKAKEDEQAKEEAEKENEASQVPEAKKTREVKTVDAVKVKETEKAKNIHEDNNTLGR